MQPKRDPRTPVEMEDLAKIPAIFLYVCGIVGAGVVVQILMWIFGIGGGLVIWPFIFAVCVLLIINDASSSNAVGVPPLQAYAFFFGTLIAIFGFVFLVSKTINPWIIIAGVVGIGIYLANDWKKRKLRELEIARRRAAGLCVRCAEPVGSELDDVCHNCGLPVNAERLNLLRLGRAIANKGGSQRAREAISGKSPDKGKAKLANLQQQTRAYKYKKR
ncbi:MAG TPA: hypothetical protein VHD56_11910 [Tepidisphaeraceae bacterium]|nr:hypothetical protein [Tepidisphaeraceae bacterium]